jgi:phage shock protein A
MGGKRSDQHNIDPGEAGATDYKWAPTHQDEGIIAREKAELASNDVKERESFIPRSGKNPALADLQEKREQRAREAATDGESGGGDT